MPINIISADPIKLRSFAATLDWVGYSKSWVTSRDMKEVVLRTFRRSGRNGLPVFEDIDNCNF